MNDLMKQFVEDVNKERRRELKDNQTKSNVNELMESMKIIYDSAIAYGFGEYQATTYANSYFSCALNNNQNQTKG